MIVKDRRYRLAIGRNIDRGIEHAGASRIVANRNGHAPIVAAIGGFRERDLRIARQERLINHE